MPSSRNDGRPLHAAGTVVVVSPGGLEHGGGIGRQMGYFLAAQAQAGQSLDYRLVDTRGPWFLGASPQHAGFAALRLAAALLTILRVRLSPGACVLHVNVTGRGSTIRKLVVTAAARLLAVRYLLHVHDYDYAAEYRQRGALMRFLIGGMFRGASAVLVLGERERSALTVPLGLAPERVTVLHNAVPDPHPGNFAAAPPAHAGQDCRLLFLGRLSERKGVPELLQALASPDLARRPWQATLAGDGPVEAFRRMAAALGIAERVTFSGWVDQPTATRLCAAADVLVLPSHAEGLAMAVLEGLSHGLAVLATPVGAHAEVIEPEVSGLFVPCGDVTALAAALARLIDDPQLRQRLGQGARRRFRERFDVAVYARRLQHLHAQMLAPPQATGFTATEQA